MLLQCEGEYGDGEDGGGWLGAGTLASLGQLNEECLELLAQQARALPAHLTLTEIARHWEALDAAGRERAGACLYLLLDAGFAEPQRWRWRPGPQAADVGGERTAFFTVPAAPQVAQGVFIFAWHLARCRGSAARLLLGMPALSVRQLARHTLSEVRALALSNLHWLRPRWGQRPAMWREFLVAAAGNDPATLERVRLRGQRLLAAEARQGLAPGHAGGVRALLATADAGARAGVVRGGQCARPPAR
jgi:hypothetical protein